MTTPLVTGANPEPRMATRARHPRRQVVPIDAASPRGWDRALCCLVHWICWMYPRNVLTTTTTKQGTTVPYSCMNIHISWGMLNVSCVFHTQETFSIDHEIYMQYYYALFGHDCHIETEKKIAAILQTTFSNAFSWMKMYEFRFRFHWSLFPRFELRIF